MTVCFTKNIENKRPNLFHDDVYDNGIHWDADDDDAEYDDVYSDTTFHEDADEYLTGPLVTQDPLFAARVVYDLLFFFIVIIIVLNLIFGVIIDTFADLRSEKQRKEEILKTTCFICGGYSPT